MTTVRFDAYSATVDADGDELLPLVQRELEAQGHATEFREFRPKHYRNGVQVSDSHGVLCSVQWGGNNGAGASVQAQGAQAHGLAGMIRAQLPDHTVARIDACNDRSAPSLFDRSWPLLHTIAKDNRLKTSTAGDWLDAVDGRTLVIGSKQSPRFIRLYEKGKQLIAQGDPHADPNHVRQEVQYRPEHRHQKQEAARLTPLEVFGIAPWTREALEAFGGLLAPEIVLRSHRPSDYERARFFLCKQYGKILSRWAEEAGGWNNLGAEIRDQIQEAQEQAERLRLMGRRAA